MAITYTWEINGTACKRDVADGYFTNVVYRVKGMDGTEEKARRTGEKPTSSLSHFHLDSLLLTNPKRHQIVRP